MRAITRRQALTTLAGAGAGALALAACGRGDGGTDAAATDPAGSRGSTSTTTTTAPASGRLTADMFEVSTSCAITPEETEGPYYFDVDSIRRDIREDRDGARLRLGVRVLDSDGCTPVPDAVVEVWHCDAGGVYSGFESGAGETFLRGGQLSDRDGIVEFTTIYPGWYRGRTVHIHAKVHVDDATALTTQMFFDDDYTASVYAAEPYDSRTGRDTFNGDDMIFDDALLLTLADDGDGSLGLVTFVVAA